MIRSSLSPPFALLDEPEKLTRRAFLILSSIYRAVGFMIQVGVEGYEKYEVPMHARYDGGNEGPPFPPS